MSYALNAQVAQRSTRAQAKPVPPPAPSGEDLLTAIGTVAHIARHETIFNEGDDALYSYKVVSGAVRLSKVMADGRRQISDFALPGNFFGLDWTAEYAVTAEALTDVTVVRYMRSHLERLSEEKSAVRNRVFDVVRQDLWAAQNHLVMLGCQTAKERVASFLVMLAKRNATASGQAIDLPMGRQDIADYLGLTIETVCRTLSDLKLEKLVTTPNRHQVVVSNLTALRAIAQGDV